VANELDALQSTAVMENAEMVTENVMVETVMVTAVMENADTVTAVADMGIETVETVVTEVADMVTAKETTITPVAVAHSKDLPNNNSTIY
jgi:hypothetical protein